MRNTTLLLFVTVAAACALRRADSPLQFTDGSPLAVRGGNIWYRVVGNGAGTPLVLLHGGPGTPSTYLRSLEALGDDRRVVRYDQLGAGHADRITDTSLINIGRYVEELEALRRHLAIRRMHLYGHSWGATLALEYYRAYPRHVASLTLASPALEAPAFYAHVRSLFLAMPESLSRAVRLHEQGAPHDTMAYRSAMSQYNHSYGTRKPNLIEMDSLVRSSSPALGQYTMGTSVFAPNGTMSAYDATPFLRQVKVPVLFTVGEFDLVGPDVVRRHAGLTPGARFVVIPDAAHIVMWDNPSATLAVLRSFLREIDARR